MESNVYDIANELVNFSHRSIFLTGKAGTGKTTFLRNLKESTSKQIAVVAPTGVAAVNAGGTTIHSFFQIAPGTLIPTREANYQFLAKQQVTSVRRKMYAALELLVIDEISMVRADLLDIIDIILRHYRYRQNEPFGGVQVMFIGDMHQLPPVCNNEDWMLLQSFYESPYFFHSKVMQELKPVYVEFDKIFRQTNMQFVDLLNNVRNNHLSQHDFDLLEKRYNPNFEPKDDEGYILLTTHNAKADVVNSSKLNEIKEDSYFFEAAVNGDFPDKNFPAEQRLQLKVGAKVMFIANDKQPVRRYFNGRIGIISHISKEEGIFVLCNGDVEPIAVERETWNNVKYTHDKETNTIKEDISGSFTQIPLRLAWAITIHKSQGLTFEKAVIDAGSAFSSGQVYVALSRCTSLDGLVLTTRINPLSLSVDDKVVAFSQNKLGIDALNKIAEQSKYEYTFKILKEVFSLEDVNALTKDSINYLLKYTKELGEQSEQYLNTVQSHIYDMFQVGQKFVYQLSNLFASHSDNVQERVAAASDYFQDKINEVLAMIEASPVITDSKTQAEDYVDKFKAIYELLSLRLWVIIGLKSDCSVSNYFAVKASYRTPKLKIVAYAGATERSRIKTDHPELYKIIAAERNEICEDLGMPVYFVATTKMIVAMANLLPQTHDDLLKIKGFGKEKVKRYGDRFLALVNQYCRDKGIDAVQRFDFDDDAAEVVDIIKVPKKKSKKAKEESDPVVVEKSSKVKSEKIPKIPTLDISLALLLQYKDVERVATEREMAVGTIWGHAKKLVEQDKILPSLLIDMDDVELIQSAYMAASDKSLAALYEYFAGNYSYETMRVALASIRIKEKESVSNNVESNSL